MKIIPSGSELYKIIKNITLGARDTTYQIRALITQAEYSALKGNIVGHDY